MPQGRPGHPRDRARREPQIRLPYVPRTDARSWGFAQQLRKQIARSVRDLGSAMQLENIAYRIDTCDGAACLQRNAGMAADLEFEIDHAISVPEPGLDVPESLFNGSSLPSNNLA